MWSLLQENITGFDSPARSLFKTMTMTTGELDFDSLFRQDGEHDEDVAYLPASVILWVFFIVLMPILLTNLLVRLQGMLVLSIRGGCGEVSPQALQLPTICSYTSTVLCYGISKEL